MPTLRKSWRRPLAFISLYPGTCIPERVTSGVSGPLVFHLFLCQLCSSWPNLGFISAHASRAQVKHSPSPDDRISHWEVCLCFYKAGRQVTCFHSGSEFCEVGFKYSYGTMYFCLPLFLESHSSRIPVEGPEFLQGSPSLMGPEFFFNFNHPRCHHPCSEAYSVPPCREGTIKSRVPIWVLPLAPHVLAALMALSVTFRFSAYEAAEDSAQPLCLPVAAVSRASPASICPAWALAHSLKSSASFWSIFLPSGTLVPQALASLAALQC